MFSKKYVCIQKSRWSQVAWLGMERCSRERDVALTFVIDDSFYPFKSTSISAEKLTQKIWVKGNRSALALSHYSVQTCDLFALI